MQSQEEVIKVYLLTFLEILLASADRYHFSCQVLTYMQSTINAQNTVFPKNLKKLQQHTLVSKIAFWSKQ